MVVRISKALTLLLTTAFALVLVAPTIAWAGEVSNVCYGQVVNAQVGCGDGVCDAYVGENKTTCPADCGSKPVVNPGPTATPTSTATFTPSPTATFPLFFGLITRTNTPTATATGGTGTPGTETVTPTGTPVVSETEPPTSGQVGCDYVSYESRTSGWQSGYAGFAKQFVPKEDTNREVFVCTVPPFGQICLPVTPGLLDSEGSVDGIMLVDCTSSGDCRTQPSELRRIGNMLCADIVIAGSMSCTGGCALAPSGSSSLLDLQLGGLLGGIPTAAVAPIACFLLFLLLAGVGLLIFVTRRARRKELMGQGALPADELTYTIDARA